MIARAPEERQQLFLQRFEQPAHGRRIALEFAPPSADAVFIERMQHGDELGYRRLNAMPFSHRHRGAGQRTTDRIRAFAVRQPRREALEEPVSLYLWFWSAPHGDDPIIKNKRYVGNAASRRPRDLGEHVWPG